mmetsp:Transcript_16299/g.54594  ORF Transcript_16299/g.54594 Transcript_16299/m.54594 type:complete len:238 (-) Transcript_16299:31-744(-)
MGRKTSVKLQLSTLKTNFLEVSETLKRALRRRSRKSECVTTMRGEPLSSAGVSTTLLLIHDANFSALSRFCSAVSFPTSSFHEPSCFSSSVRQKGKRSLIAAADSPAAGRYLPSFHSYIPPTSHARGDTLHGMPSAMAMGAAVSMARSIGLDISSPPSPSIRLMCCPVLIASSFPCGDRPGSTDLDASQVDVACSAVNLPLRISSSTCSWMQLFMDCACLMRISDLPAMLAAASRRK